VAGHGKSFPVNGCCDPGCETETSASTHPGSGHWLLIGNQLQKEINLQTKGRCHVPQALLPPVVVVLLKALIALYETGTPFTPVPVDLFSEAEPYFEMFPQET
jgi:hypothetical protein